MHQMRLLGVEQTMVFIPPGWKAETDGNEIWFAYQWHKREEGPARQVSCNLCGEGGGTLRRIGSKPGKTYIHMSCLVERETRLRAQRQADALEKYIEEHAAS